MTSHAPVFQLPVGSPRGAGHRLRWGRIASVAGIDVYVHWSFALLVLWLFAVELVRGSGPRAALGATGLLLAVFGCVLLHELGHALVGRRLGVRTLDITLYPIGGVARLERVPERPSEELFIAAAGPAVNVGIAALLGAGLALSGASAESFVRGLLDGALLPRLVLVNVTLAAFNLLPAFPMDGGRILRAILAFKMSYARATRYAATTGQVLSVGLGLLGLLFNWFLIFIAVFVFVAAEQEARAVETRSLAAGVPVREAMIRHFRVLPTTAPLSVAASELLAGEQHDFPVVHEGRLVGMLTRDALVSALMRGDRRASVGEIATPCEAIEDSTELDAALQRLRELGQRSLPVVRNGRLVGILTTENLAEWLMLHAADQRRPEPTPSS